MDSSKFDKFKTETLNALENGTEVPENVQLSDDETKGILQGNTYAEKLRELQTMMDNAPRKFRRKYRNTENSFSARMSKIMQEKNINKIQSN